MHINKKVYQINFHLLIEKMYLNDFDETTCFGAYIKYIEY